MINKNEIRVKSSVLIIDSDLGNFGLYKAILSKEYDLECVNSLSTASDRCENKSFDVLLIDGTFNVDETEVFYKKLKAKYEKNTPILLVLEEKDNKDSIICYLAIGAREYIEKPFTKEGIINGISDTLKRKNG